jgi:hypothetical protein
MTVDNLIAAYRSAYYSLHDEYPPEVRHMDGPHFVVNGAIRDRLWLLVEINRLRRHALDRHQAENRTTGARRRLFQLIGHLSRLPSGPPAGQKKSEDRRMTGSTGHLKHSNDATVDVSNEIATYVDDLRQGTGQGFFPEDAVLVLHIDGDTVKFSLDSDLMIGRSGDRYGPYRFLDLQAYGGYRSGISRQHARITRTRDNALELMDMGSSNGTTINGARIMPRQLYRLHDGDEIGFAALKVKIYFETSYSPNQDAIH